MSHIQLFSKVIRTPAIQKRSTLALLQHTVKDALPDGRLPVAIADADLKVTVTTDPAVQLPTFYKLIWDGQVIDASKKDLVAGDDVPGKEIEVLLPLTHMTAEGLHTLDYAVYTTIGENEEIAHMPINLIVDRTSPGGGALSAPVFTKAINDLVMETSLENGKLVADIRAWFGEEAGDVATGWIAAGESPAPGDWKELTTVKHTVVNKGEAVKLSFDKADLTALADGYQSFSYKVKDQLGNPETDLADPKALRVLLSSVPANILAPVVPDFDDHALITWSDAKSGVEVEIPPYDNPDPTDKIVVVWGTQEAPPSPPIGAAPGDPFITVLVAPEVVIAGGNGALNVSYKIMRGNFTPEVGISPPTAVVVDLTIPGGVDPDPDTPAHGNLKPAIVKSADGDINLIPPQAYERNGTVTIPQSGVDGKVVWADGDVVEVSWGPTLKLPKQTINNQTSDLELSLDSATYIQPGPSGEFGVSYTVSRALVPPPNMGEALSPTTSVTVISSDDIPGGGQPLPTPIFTEANASNVINQKVGINGTPIRIPLPIDNVKADDVLVITFTGIFSFTDKDAAEIPGTKMVDNHSITDADNAAQYYDFYVSEAILKTICEFGAIATYTAANAIDTVTSPTTLVIVAVRTPGYCTVPVNPNP
jgi:hypothetical protein